MDTLYIQSNHSDASNKIGTDNQSNIKAQSVEEIAKFELSGSEKEILDGLEKLRQELIMNGDPFEEKTAETIDRLVHFNQTLKIKF